MPSCPITPPPDQMPSPRAARATITIAATINPVRHDMTDGPSESVGREHESDRGGNQSNSDAKLVLPKGDLALSLTQVISAAVESLGLAQDVVALRVRQASARQPIRNAALERMRRIDDQLGIVEDRESSLMIIKHSLQDAKATAARDLRQPRPAEIKTIRRRRRRIPHPAAIGDLTDHLLVMCPALRHRWGEMTRKYLPQALGRIIEALDHLKAAAAFFTELTHGMSEDQCGIRRLIEAIALEDSGGGCDDALDEAGDVLIARRPSAMEHFEG